MPPWQRNLNLWPPERARRAGAVLVPPDTKVSTMFSKLLALATTLAMVLPLAAGAATIHATDVTYFKGQGVKGERAESTRALGAADDRFLSLGLGGAAVFSFGQLFVGPASVTEVTLGSRPAHVEEVRVFVSETFVKGTNRFDETAFREVGRITNASPLTALNFSGVFRYLALLDTSPRQAGRDGFDIDSISVVAAPLPAKLTAVPVPASAPLLLAGVVVLAWMRRRRAA